MAKAAELKKDNSEFELRGFNHIALVARDMQETTDFWCNVLGMKLVKTIQYEDGGQHFFFDMGNGTDAIAFFWWPEVPEFQPGLVAAAPFPKRGPKSAIGSLNHLAFDVPAEKFEEYREKLKAKGVKVTHISNHNDVRGDKKNDPSLTDTTWGRSMYFTDPNGYLLEFCVWLRPFTEPDDVLHEPKTAADLVSATA